MTPMNDGSINTKIVIFAFLIIEHCSCQVGSCVTEIFNESVLYEMLRVNKLLFLSQRLWRARHRRVKRPLN